MNVAAILRVKGRNVVTARPDDSVEVVARVLAGKRIGAIVVVEPDGRIAGIVSERDVIRGVAELGAGHLHQPVHSIMTRAVLTCDEETSIDELMGLMTAKRFRHLPVVTDGKLVGIVSIGDVVKHHIAEVEMEATALRDYIAAH